MREEPEHMGIQEFYPSFRPYIKQLLLGDIGLGAGVVEIADVQSGVARTPYNNCSSNGDRFKILLSYAGHTIRWHIYFSTSHPEFAPDFSFSDDFLADPDIDDINDYVPSLANWNYHDDKALLNVVKELFLMYKKYQVSLLEDFERLQIEYTMLLNDAKIDEDNIEVLIVGGSTLKKTRTTGAGVNFWINLDVDFSSLPPGIPAVVNCGRNSAVLRVTFYNSDCSRISPELFLSPNVEQVLGKSGTHLLPMFNLSTCLMYYIPEVISILNDKVQMVVKCFEKRRDYVAALLLKLSTSILEYDSVSFFSCSFLLEVKDFFFKLDITLPVKFPFDRPQFVLRSVYHANAGRPFCQAVEDFPHSPKWDVQVMVDRALSAIKDRVESFQQLSVESASEG